MRPITILAALGGCLAVAGGSAAWTAPATATDWRHADPGDPKPVLGPPPSPGDPQWQADGEIFRQTRSLERSPRWDLAVKDAHYDGDTELKDFACAMGLDLNGRDDAALLDVINGAVRVAGRFGAKAKAEYDRPRPYHGSGHRPCLDPDDEASYPSGHAAAGWTYGLLLSELAPDRADQLMGRARAFGESRVVCGMHWASDVDAGRRGADTAIAFLHGDKAFRDDLDAARTHLQSRRRTGKPPNPAQCAAEAEAVAKRPW
jgi:acid phosphatase (class A)